MKYVIDSLSNVDMITDLMNEIQSGLPMAYDSQRYIYTKSILEKYIKSDKTKYYRLQMEINREKSKFPMRWLVIGIVLIVLVNYLLFVEAICPLKVTVFVVIAVLIGGLLYSIKKYKKKQEWVNQIEIALAEIWDETFLKVP